MLLWGSSNPYSVRAWLFCGTCHKHIPARRCTLLGNTPAHRQTLLGDAPACRQILLGNVRCSATHPAWQYIFGRAAILIGKGLSYFVGPARQHTPCRRTLFAKTPSSLTRLQQSSNPHSAKAWVILLDLWSTSPSYRMPSSNPHLATTWSILWDHLYTFNSTLSVSYISTSLHICHLAVAPSILWASTTVLVTYCGAAQKHSLLQMLSLFAAAAIFLLSATLH